MVFTKLEKQIIDLQFNHAMAIKKGDVKIGDNKDAEFRRQLGILKSKEQPTLQHSLKAWQEYLAK